MASLKQQYLDGTFRLQLDASKINADWGKSRRAVELANCAFSVYYHARNYLDTLSGEAYKTLNTILREARTAGCGWGVDDLDDAFEHAAEETGSWWWTDETTENYYVKKSYGMFPYNVTGAYAGPKACVNFLDDLESRAKDASDSFVVLSSTLYDAKRAGDAQDWEAFGAASEKIQSLEKKVKPWLFLMPDQVRTSAAGVFKYTDAIDSVYQAATEYADLKYKQKWDTTDALGFMAMKHALKCLPVLGEFYSQALSLFITLDGEMFWKNYTDRKDARIRRAIQG